MKKNHENDHEKKKIGNRKKKSNKKDETLYYEYVLSCMGLKVETQSLNYFGLSLVYS